jgi:hypothetical protein
LDGLPLGILAVFSVTPLGTLASLAAVIAVLGSVVVFTLNSRMFDDDPMFWSCFWAGFSLSFLPVGLFKAIGAKVAEDIMLSIASAVGVPYAIGSCF